MCGIAGIVFSSGRKPEEEICTRLRAMAAIQAHRGPDADGFWIGTIGEGIVGFGHRRLAIVDLSDAGNQPLVSPCGQFVLNYNGELYNYVELRDELKGLGCAFTSDCDTEVVLQAYKTWGPAAFDRFNGMWALAVADRRRRCVVLSRDRFGEKPLYTYHQNGGLYFSSEIKAICVGSKSRFPVHLPAVGRFLVQSQLDAQEETFFEGVAQVPMGHWMEVMLDEDGPIRMAKPRPYWHPQIGTVEATERDAVDRLRHLLTDSVRIRPRSDVPVGVLVSGGLDSSSIAAVVHGLKSAEKLILVSAVGDDPRTSEEPFADTVSLHLARYVHKVRLNPEPAEAFNLLGRTIWHNDEPIGGFSAVAHYLLMQKARELGVTVLLSGQGADEGLCGYRKFTPFYLADLLHQHRYGRLTKAALGLLLPPWSFISEFGLADAQLYLPKVMKSRSRFEVLGTAFRDHAWEMDLGLGGGSLVDRQMLDLTRFSVPALTHYEDRMSMASSREIRLPFLDHRLAVFFMNLPADQKLHNSWTKWILRKAIAPLLPQKIAWRSDKKGFTTPIDTWLRADWRNQIQDLFDGEMVSASLGLVDASKVRSRFRTFLASPGRSSQISDIFNPLSLEIWARGFREYLA